MYCHACGIHNTDDHSHCQVCKADLTKGEVPENVTVYADLMHFPLIPLISHTLKSTSPLLWILIVPILSLLYLFRRLTGTPFLSALMNCHAPKLHLTNVERLQNLHKASFHSVSSFLEQEGFEPLLDLEDVSMTQGILLHIRYHRERKVFGMAHISKVSGKTSYVTFLAFIPEKSVVSVDNTHALPIQFPQNLMVRHFPQASIQESYQQFLDVLSESPREPAALSVANFLRNQYRLRTYSVKLGLQQQLLHHKGEGASHVPSVSACYFHPGNVAVRKCTSCGTALCDLCYTEYDERYLCQKCLPLEETPRVSVPSMPEGFSYAGFGIRSVATLMDAVLVIAFLAVVFLGIFYGTLPFLANNSEAPYPFFVTQFFTVVAIAFSSEDPYPFLVTQFVAVVTIAWYLIVPVKKFGATFGQKIFGLRIIDKHGKPPEMVTATVRFVCPLVAFLFIFPLLGYFFFAYPLGAFLFTFPLLGYFFGLFNKNKQGLHDRLAGTFVITKRPILKAMLSWSVLCAFCAGMVWQVYQYRDVFAGLPLLSSLAYSSDSFQANIELDAHWLKNMADEDSAIISYVNRGEHCLVSTSKSVYAIEMRTGNTLWENHNVPGLLLQPVSKDMTFPLLGTQFLAEQERLFLSRLDPNPANYSGRFLLKGIILPSVMTRNRLWCMRIRLRPGLTCKDISFGSGILTINSSSIMLSFIQACCWGDIQKAR